MATKFFKTPFSVVGPYIKDKHRNVCFTIICDNDLANRIVDKLNNQTSEKFVAKNKMDYILINDVIVLKTRGWGYLTGTLKLQCEDAVAQQKQLVKFVVDKLKA